MKKNKYLVIVTVVMASVSFLTLFSISSYADDQSSGCGLGWMVMKHNSLLSSSLRATTNAVASNTIAMTSGTSGCAKHDIVMKNKEALYFAEANYQKLQSEMAEGRGEHLAAFAKVLGCQNQDAAQIGVVFQKDYEQIWLNDQIGPSQLLQNSANSISRARMCI